MANYPHLTQDLLEMESFQTRFPAPIVKDVCQSLSEYLHWVTRSFPTTFPASSFLFFLFICFLFPTIKHWIITQRHGRVDGFLSPSLQGLLTNISIVFAN